MADFQTEHKNLEVLRTELENERSSFKPHWKELGDFILPRRPRMSITDVNKGDRRNFKIIDSTGTIAARTLRAGMMGGVTSPSRNWFKLTTPDSDLAEFGPVRDWLHDVEQVMRNIYLRSNIYNVLPTLYGDLGVFGTGAMFWGEVFDGNVGHAWSFPIGSYAFGTDRRGRANVFYREFRMTVRQVVEEFGRKKESGTIDWSNISNHIKSMYNVGQLHTWVDVRHFILPNEEYDPNQIGPEFKRYKSIYYESGRYGNTGTTLNDTKQFLSVGGFDIFPVFTPRWEVTGEDTYGTDCPGMIALGDIKALQLMQKRKAQAVEKIVNPPMTGPSTLRTQKASTLPGDITYVDAFSGQQGFRPAHEVRFRVNEIQDDIRETQIRIGRSMYADLFLMLANSDRRQFTAREIDERHEEKLLALGPVLEQLNQDLLDPLTDTTFEYALRQGRIPPPPPEIEGQDLKVEYVSIMHQAQKMVGVAGIERTVAFVMQLGQVMPAAFDKLNTDQAIDEYADMMSVSPNVIHDDDETAAIREQRALEQQQAQAMEAVQAGAGAAKDLSQADLSGNNALSAMVDEASPI